MDNLFREKQKPIIFSWYYSLKPRLIVECDLMYSTRLVFTATAMTWPVVIFMKPLTHSIKKDEDNKYAWQLLYK